MSIKILKNRDFSLLTSAKVFSSLGTNIQNFVLSLYILKITGSSVMFAAMLSIAIIPQIIFSQVAGVLTDWVNKKVLMVSLDIISGSVCVFFLFILKINGSFSITNIYILVILLSIISTFYLPNVKSVLPIIVDKNNIIEANSINVIALKICSLVSPIIAALLYNVYSMFIVLLINCLSFFLAALIEYFIYIPKQKGKNKIFSVANIFNDYIEGIKYIKDNRYINTIVLFTLILNFTLTPLFTVCFPYVCKEKIMVDNIQFGVFQSVMTLGMLLGPILISYMSKKANNILGIIVLISIISTGLLTVFTFDFNLLGSKIVIYYLILIIAPVVTFNISIFNIVFNSDIQKNVPKDLLGRVFATVNTISIIAMPLGQILIGFMLKKLELWSTFFIIMLILIYSMILLKRRAKTFDNSSCNEA